MAISGFPTEVYLRALIAGEKMRPRPLNEYAEIRRQLAAIGNNINQIARKANAGFATKEDVRELKFLMRTIEAKMTELVKQ